MMMAVRKDKSAPPRAPQRRRTTRELDLLALELELEEMELLERNQRVFDSSSIGRAAAQLTNQMERMSEELSLYLEDL